MGRLLVSFREQGQSSSSSSSLRFVAQCCVRVRGERGVCCGAGACVRQSSRSMGQNVVRVRCPLARCTGPSGVGSDCHGSQISTPGTKYRPVNPGSELEDGEKIERLRRGVSYSSASTRLTTHAPMNGGKEGKGKRQFHGSRQHRPRARLILWCGSQVSGLV